MAAPTSTAARIVCPHGGSRDTRFTYPNAADYFLRLFFEFDVYRCRICRARFRRSFPEELLADAGQPVAAFQERAR